MKNFIQIFYFVFLLIFIQISITQAKTDSLIVKLKKDNFKIELSNFLSNYSLKQLINPKLLNFDEQKSKKNYPKIQSISNSLSRVKLLTYESKINKNKLIKALEETNYFEYVEPYPERNICNIPNDSLFNEQYYMNLVKITNAWDSIKIKSFVLVGVVDTGVDYTHIDLSNSIWINPGEDGIDENGNDKRTNGIDDDGNGYVDDWHGWDFLSSDSTGQDNDPFPAHPHGTHVSGTIAATINNTIGIAGMCDSIKILPIKVGGDYSYNTSLANTYEGLLYAAKMGAKVINCSWGGTSKSTTEQEVINLVINLGATVVAAAGNNNADTPFYPAAYDGVVSVAATDSNDTRAFFSNYNYSVDVTAPGIDIISTVPTNEYQKMMGTSMASPIATGVAAMIRMVHPEYSTLQVAEHLIATTDNIDSLNPDFVGKLGTGRVNALKAVTSLFPKHILVKSIEFNDGNNNLIFENNENCSINLNFANNLNDINNLRIYVRALGNSDITFNPKVIEYGLFLTNFEVKLKNVFAFKLPNFNTFDEKIEFEFTFYDGDTLITRSISKLFVNPSYLNFNNNFVITTFNSKGNIGFNDYPFNEQGVGFIYKNSANVLYEGSLMISSDTLLADVARNEGQMNQDRSFVPVEYLNYLPLANPLLLAGQAFFTDNILIQDATPHISVKQTIIQPKQPDNVIYSIYDIINNKNKIQDSVYIGLYFDWDIGISGVDNLTYWDKNLQFAVVKNISVDSLPKIGIKMMSDFPVNFWAIDNDGHSEDNPGVWDGFTKSEKLRFLKSGIGRDSSSITDISNVISAGPIYLGLKDTVRICFALFANSTIEELQNSIGEIQQYADNSNLTKSNYNLEIEESKIVEIFPNPLNNNQQLNIVLQVQAKSKISLQLYDMLGRKVMDLLSDTLDKGKYLRNFDLTNIAQGFYCIKFNIENNISTVPLLIQK
ncbi:MAG: S8 family peptidase [Candidatus Kapaibacteriota bacterium]